MSEQEFEYDGQRSDFDDTFVYENVIVLAEYTCSQPASVGNHLKIKKIVYDKILAEPAKFIDFLRVKFPTSADEFPIGYHPSSWIIKILYCSRYDFDEQHKLNVPGPVYGDYPAIRYFTSLTSHIKLSARNEFLDFLEIDVNKVGVGGRIGRPSTTPYDGLVLPEANSNFNEGYKVVSFYADPGSLLRAAYVLRRDGWKDPSSLYQRMVQKSKIEAIRSYLREEKRVFVNNIIVTLPNSVKPINAAGTTIDTKSLIETSPVKISLPTNPNSIGLIDGQHRVFAYYETENDDPDIARLRDQQNLLVTGIIYPDTVTEADKRKFEAQLFLEINSNQATARTDLKQAIGVVLKPFAVESIAARILGRLARIGPLAGFVEQHFFDSGKLKTSSIVSYGLKPLVKTGGQDSLFYVWPNDRKDDLTTQKDDQLLGNYVDYCVGAINQFLSAIKNNLASERWTSDSKVSRRALTTTYVNAYLIVMRLLISRGISTGFNDVRDKFQNLDAFDMSGYHSSQYARLAEKMVGTFFRGTS